MSKHTTGPWSVGKVSHEKQRVDIDSLHADQTLGYHTWRGLARAYGCNDMPAEGTAAMLANARLIAAAPELLDALELLVDNPYRDGTESDERLRRIARAAIAKATGENT